MGTGTGANTHQLRDPHGAAGYRCPAPSCRLVNCCRSWAVRQCRRISEARVQTASLRGVSAALVCLLLFSLTAPAKTSRKKKASTRTTADAALDRAYLQKIWDGWEQLDASKQAQFYAEGSHTFFDIAPLKYTNWSEYQAGVTKELADYKSAKFTVNNDAEIHPCGTACTWSTATVKQDAVMKSGRRDLATFRWTAIFQRLGGKWLMVHEHVSMPAP
jgi:ketosteroid isomerase-like protein